jgi:AcrR family transcriptional regulator
MKAIPRTSEKSDLRTQRERRRREACREAILHAAERVIVRKGYSASTMDDIAREAQFSKATLYKYFPGRGEILFEIIGSYFDEVRNGLAGILAGEGTARDKLLAMIRLILRHQEEKENVSRVLWMDRSMLKILRVFVAVQGKPSEVTASDRKMLNLMRRKRQLVIEVAARILEEGIASGQFRRMETRAAVTFLEAVLQGYAHTRFWLGEKASVRQAGAAETLHRFILQGIQSPGGPVKEN